MKDSVLNLLVFLLTFLTTAVFFLAAYGVSMLLIPGGKGLVFSNPFAAALVPALVIGLVTAQYRSVRRPGVFPVTWGLQALAFFLLLTLPVPLIQQMAPLRASDSSPLSPGKFLPLADGSQLLASGPTVVLIPDTTDTVMSVSTQTQFDPLNQRFVFSSDDPKELGSTGPERNYFQYTPALAALQTDLLALYSILRESAAQNTLAFVLQAAAITWLFMGLYVFFSLRTWPLVHMVLVLILSRMGILFLVYAFWSLPSLVDLWVPGSMVTQARIAAPIVLVGTAAATLFFMTWLSKPWKREALG